jgi:hypothetical protein
VNIFATENTSGKRMIMDKHKNSACEYSLTKTACIIEYVVFHQDNIQTA